MLCSAMIAVIFGPLLLYLLYKSYKRPANFPPGPQGIPFFGSVYYIKSDHSHLDMLKLAKEYGNVFSLKQWGKNIVVVCGAEANREVLVNKDISGRNISYIIGLLKGEKRIGISHNDVNPAWAEYRKMLSDARNLAENRPDEVIERGSSGIIKELEQISQNGEAVSMITQTQLGSYTTLMSIHFGADRLFSDRAKNLESFKIFQEIADVVVDKSFALPSIFPGLHKIWIPESAKHFLSITRKVLQYFADQYATNEKELDTKKTKNFIDIFLTKMKNGGELPQSDYSDHILRIILFDLIPTSVENVSLLMQYGALYLAGHQDIQEKLHVEIDDVLGSKSEAEASDRLKMPYANATAYEVLRNANVTPVNVPRKTEKDAVLSGFSIPKNTPVLLNTYSAHLDEAKWKNAKEFDPENFLDEEGKFTVSKWFMPFGGGIRKCPGAWLAKQLLFTFLVKLVQKFHIKPESDDAVLEYDPVPGFIRRPKPQKLRLVLRS